MLSPSDYFRLREYFCNDSFNSYQPFPSPAKCICACMDIIVFYLLIVFFLQLKHMNLCLYISIIYWLNGWLMFQILRPVCPHRKIRYYNVQRCRREAAHYVHRHHFRCRPFNFWLHRRLAEGQPNTVTTGERAQCASIFYNPYISSFIYIINNIIY